jgi:3-methyladenine DNA glycosylase AlkD
MPRPSLPKLAELIAELAAAADPKRAEVSAWFFKTGPGQYGEGDVFLGMKVPVLRAIALRYRNLALPSLKRLLYSEIHEHRLAALEILVDKYEGGGEADKQEIYDFYLLHAKRINNWDLVDASAPYIVGAHLRTRSRVILRKLARSENLWERRIAIVATFGLIRIGEIEDTFQIAEMLLSDQHDLIHKAVGWALREAGKKAPDQLPRFLAKHYAALPRTALRYAIERYPPEQRKQLLRGEFANFLKN